MILVQCMKITDSAHDNLMIVDSITKSTSDVECQADIFAYCNNVE